MEEKKEQKNNAMGLWLSVGLWVIIGTVVFGWWYSCEKKDAANDPGFKPGFTVTTTVVAPTNVPVQKQVPKPAPLVSPKIQTSMVKVANTNSSSLAVEANVAKGMSFAMRKRQEAWQQEKLGTASNFNFSKEGGIELGKLQ